MSYTDNKNQGYDKGYEAFEKFLYMIADRQRIIDEYEKIIDELKTELDKFNSSN